MWWFLGKKSQFWENHENARNEGICEFRIQLT
jgi:hypothetical protein